jgi:MraZ protein
VVESGGFEMFIGEYHHNIDDKSRLIIPSKYRSELGEQFIITRGLDKCIFIYSMNEWNNIINKLKSLSFTKKDARNFMRFFLSGATVCEFDKQGRINITSPLVHYANLKHECVIIGVNERLEIWDKDSFDNFMKTNEEEFSEISEHLFDGEESA